jgi:hypothetical protein
MAVATDARPSEGAITPDCAVRLLLVFGRLGLRDPAPGTRAAAGRERARSNAPPATPTFSAMPIHVDARRPIAGISQNPAASAPAAAPIVFQA